MAVLKATGRRPNDVDGFGSDMVDIAGGHYR